MKYEHLNFLLFHLPVIIFLSYGIYSLVFNGLYSVFPGYLMHNVSLIIICFAYIIGNRQYRHVPQPRRALVVLGFIISALYFSGIFWETLAHMASGTPEPNMWVVYFNTLVGFGIVYFLLRGRGEFKPSILLSILPIFAISIYAIMWYNGFFYRDVLYNLGGPNPIREPIWLIHKITAIPMFVFGFQNKPENKTVDWKIF